MLIFVTEDFSEEKQVKLDYPQRVPKDKVGVLKLNFTKKFNTGIYPYSMMELVLTSVYRSQHPNILKTTMSSQEWCGHIFTQFNLKKDQYDVKSYSSFEQEGDRQLTLDRVLLEDEVWNLIGLDYQSLPTGEINIIPGIFHSTLLHNPLQTTKVSASIIQRGDNITMNWTTKKKYDC